MRRIGTATLMFAVVAVSLSAQAPAGTTAANVEAIQDAVELKAIALKQQDDLYAAQQQIADLAFQLATVRRQLTVDAMRRIEPELLKAKKAPQGSRWDFQRWTVVLPQAAGGVSERPPVATGEAPRPQKGQESGAAHDAQRKP